MPVFWLIYLILPALDYTYAFDFVPISPEQQLSTLLTQHQTIPAPSALRPRTIVLPRYMALPSSLESR